MKFSEHLHWKPNANAYPDYIREEIIHPDITQFDIDPTPISTIMHIRVHRIRTNDNCDQRYSLNVQYPIKRKIGFDLTVRSD